MSVLTKPFNRIMVQTGSLDDFCYKSECDEPTLKRLMARFESDKGAATSAHGRRLNNFCIGSDPEFVFVDQLNRKVQAAHLGLLPGIAIGCDQNQRLGELRGYPSTSVVHHVASIMSSFRWMYRKYPDVRGFAWRAGARFQGDGIGGHVHFGRKRPGREAEVAALDGLAHLFYNMGFFDRAEWDARRGGDERNQVYGQYGDIRPQLHGYEYRTLPSWLCSPLKAFVVITASKLAVLDPPLTTPWANRLCGTPAEGFAIIGALARYFAGRDDDALLLSQLLKRPAFVEAIQQWGGTNPDFRQQWGIPTAPVHLSPSVSNILPSVIKPHSTEVDEMQRYLESLEPLTFREAPAMFTETLPRNYYWLPDQCRRGIQYGGAGDVLHNLVGHRDRPVSLTFGGDYATVSGNLFNSFTSAQKTKVRRMFPRLRTSSDTSVINFGRNMMGVDNIRNVRQFLLHSDLFPLWTVEAVKESSLSEFTSKQGKVVNKKKTPLERKL